VAVIAILALGLGAFVLTRVTRREVPHAAPQLKAVRDPGHQTIQLDQPAIVFHAQFGSGDQFEWDQQP
jgi:hypothetical protein